MSASTSSSSTDTPGSKECFKLAYQQEEKTSQVAGVWLGLAIPFGLIFGAIIALMIFRFCCTCFWKTLREEDEEGEERNSRDGTIKKGLRKLFPFFFLPGRKIQPIESSNALKAKSTQFGYKRMDPDQESNISTPERKHSSDSNADAPLGLAEALLETTDNQTEIELARQDVEAVENIEKSLIETRTQMSEALIQVGLNRISEGNRTDREIISAAIERVHKRVREIQRDIESSFEAEVQTLKDKREKDDTDYKDNLKSLKTATKRKRHVLFREVLVELRTYLKSNTKLTADKIDDLVGRIEESLGKLEVVLNEFLDAKIQVLMERTAHRKYLLASLKNTENQLNRAISDQEKATCKSLKNLVEERKMSEKVQAELMRELRHALEKLKKRHSKEVKKHMEDSKKRLKQVRNERMDKLKHRHQEQLKRLIEKTEATSDASEFLDVAENLLRKQAAEYGEFWAEVDRDEASKMNQAILKLQDQGDSDLQKEADAFLDRLKRDAKLSQSELRATMKQFEMEISELQRLSKMELKVSKDEEKEKLANMKKHVAEEIAKLNAEGKAAAEKQKLILEKVLDTQLGLDMEDREQILAEHKNSRAALSNLLKLRKLSQDKQLEQRIAERRASLEEKLEEKQRQAKKSATRSHKEAKDLQRFMDGEFEKEMKLLEEEKAKMIANMKSQFAKDTEILLKEQNMAMAELIGKLQVSQARRQALIDRQEKMVRRMEQLREVELKIHERAKEAPELDSKKLKSLLKEHKADVQTLNHNLSETRQRQLQNLRDKLEMKKKSRMKNLEMKFEDETQALLNRSLKNKSNLTNGLMSQKQLQSQQKRAIDHLDSEMYSEIHKGRIKLNRELESELQKCLVDQKKKFLGQLATIMELPSRELRETRPVSRRGDDHRRRNEDRRDREHDVDEYIARGRSNYSPEPDYKSSKLPPLPSRAPRPTVSVSDSDEDRTNSESTSSRHRSSERFPPVSDSRRRRQDHSARMKSESDRRGYHEEMELERPKQNEYRQRYDDEYSHRAKSPKPSRRKYQEEEEMELERPSRQEYRHRSDSEEEESRSNRRPMERARTARRDRYSNGYDDSDYGRRGK